MQAKPTMHSCKLYSLYGIDVAPCGNSRQAPAQQLALMRSGSASSCATSSSVGSFEITEAAFDARESRYGGHEVEWVDKGLDRLLMDGLAPGPPCTSSSFDVASPCTSSSFDVALYSSVMIEDVTEECEVPSSVVVPPVSRQASVDAAMAMHAIDDEKRRSHAPVVSAAVGHFTRLLPNSCRPDRKSKAKGEAKGKAKPKPKAKGEAKGKTSTSSPSTTASSTTTTSSTETDCPIRVTDTWNTFRSRRFKNAVKSGNAQGLGPEAHKALRVEAYSKARDDWWAGSGERQCTSS